MKKLFTLFVLTVCFISAGMTVNAQWAYNGTHIYNTNTGNVGISTNTPGKLFDVAKNTTEPTIRVYNLGGFGGATFQMTDMSSGADWKFKATLSGGFKIRDNAMALDVMTVEQNAMANAIYIKQGGYVGIGTNSPVEQLDVNGAVKIGNTANSNAGTIRWDGTNFLGYDGATWKLLDVQADNDWIIVPNPAPGPLNPQLYPMNPPGSISTGFPGLPNNLAWIHGSDVAAPGLFPHMLACESTVGGAFSASEIFQISNGPANPMMNYSVGLFNQDMTYKVCVGGVLTPTFQGDNTTMLRAWPSGIVDLANQSRVRAYQMAPILGQLIQPNIWTPVNFTNDAPLPQGYDEQNEFTVAMNANMPTPPENAFFTATTEGYYQVNARVEFNGTEWEMGQVMVNQNSYVSIAIYTGFQGVSMPYAIGNNLQIGYLNMMEPKVMVNNNAPNVSDVVYLLPGQTISIYVYQSAMTPMNLVPGAEKIYVSIHKVS